MSIRSDRAEERRARKNAEKDLGTAKAAARKAVDLKDPRFLGEAAFALSRGPLGLALFGARRGLDVARERRAEQSEALRALAHDAKVDAKAAAKEDRKQAAKERKIVEKELAKKRRRFSPLVLTGLLGGAAVAGATAYFLRDQKTSSSSAPTPAPTPAEQGMAAAAATYPQAGVVDPDASGEDLVVDTPDPEGPKDQAGGTTPSAGTAPTTDSAAPGAAAGIAPQPEPTDGEGDTPRP